MKLRRMRMVACVLAASMLFTACGKDGATEPAEVSESEVTAESSADAEEEVSELPALSLDEAKAIWMDPSKPVQERIDALLSQMTIEEKAFQMVQPEQSDIELDEVKKYDVGSVLSGGGSAPRTGNKAEDWENRVNELKSAALESRLGIPLLYGIDAVHGNNNVYGATVFPHNIGLGAANDPELMEEIGTVVAKEVRAIGVQWDFAPCLANPQNELWGRTYEGFSERAEDVAPLGAAFIKGLQGDISGDTYMTDEHVIACAKHYIGEGYTLNGVNQGDVKMTAEEFDSLLESGIIDPYKHAVNEDVLTVMPSYNSVDGLKCHANKHLIQEVLKDQLGFKGFVISDYNAIQQISASGYREQIRVSIDAGVDMLMEVTQWRDTADTIVKLVESGELSEERVNDAVSRILYAKFKAGLFEETIASDKEKELLAGFGSEEAREVARRAVRESLVLLKNEPVNGENSFEAMKNAKNIVLAGAATYDMGRQCGGWTISWQGQAGKIDPGTTIIEGVYNQVKDTAKVSQSVDGRISESEADCVIAVFGEMPYAETNGDRKPNTLTIAAADQTMLKNLQESLVSMNPNMPKVAVIVAGRPVNITEYMDMFDVVVMAWLPGTEGEGIADVLFGDYDFTGTLKYTWVKDPEDIATKFEVGEDKILFPYGTGLNKSGDSINK
ncbi:MAG: glycoside hydrolase family 3 protein [Lachnospiraceae bacterium]|nr:glycoside hydrolase family 3 protein [Lachnospiraceae bacterium]